MRGRSNFTLIELLVVVAVIALLASLLLPALSKARQQAQTAVCASNLKQIGVGLHSYCDDFNSYLPEPREASSGNDYYWWHDKVAPYAGAKTVLSRRNSSVPFTWNLPNSGGNMAATVFTCPTTLAVANPAKPGALGFVPEYVCCSYGVTFQCSPLRYGTSTPQTAFCASVYPADVFDSLRITSNTMPSRSAYFLDSPIDNYSNSAVCYYYSSFVKIRHGSSANFWMVDGHVERAAATPYTNGKVGQFSTTTWVAQ